MRLSPLRPLFLFMILSSNLSFAKTLDRIVAVVQGKAILLSDVKSLKEQIEKSSLLRNFYKLEGELTNQKVLTRLVEDNIMRIKLKELSSDISGDEVNRQIESIAKDNKISVAQLKVLLKNQGTSFDSYFDALKSTLERRTLNARELQRSGSTLSDEELKTIYKNKAPPEYKLSVLVEKATKKNLSLLSEIRDSFKKGKITPAKLKEYPNYVDLGWVPAEQVADAFKKFMENAQVGDAFGPIKKESQYQLLLVESIQRGSDENFEAVKERVRDSVENGDLDKRFQQWIEKQKNQIEVTVHEI